MTLTRAIVFSCYSHNALLCIYIHRLLSPHKYWYLWPVEFIAACRSKSKADFKFYVSSALK